MSKVRILIVEDELLIAEELRQCLEGYGYEVLDIVDNVPSARRDLEIYKVDILLIDIMLKGEEDGISLALDISKNQRIPTIFITSLVDEETIKRALEAKPSAYLLKPYNERELRIAIDMAFHNYEHKKITDFQPQQEIDQTHFTFNKHVFIKDSHRLERLEYDDILWMKAENTYVHIETLKKNYLLTSDTLGSMLDKLSYAQMLRVHRSYAVNKDKVVAITGNQLTIEERQIPIGKNYRTSILQHFPTV